MRAEIITSGSELLLGETIDTNGPWIANKLRHIGIDCHFKATVGDNLTNLIHTFKEALSRADLIFTTGGLGPTQDDITKEALAQALDKPLVFDESLAQAIEAKFYQRGRIMTENNLRQAYYPKGATILKTYPGTAPGIHYTLKRKGGTEQHIFLMPGVPSEMKLMMKEEIIPNLLKAHPHLQPIFTRTIKCWGIGEADIAELLAPINDELDTKINPKLSFLASGIEGIRVRLSSKNYTQEEADRLIIPYKNRIVTLLGDKVFGFDEESMESTVASLLVEKKLTLSLFESYTKGLMAERLHHKTIPSSYFKGGVIADKQYFSERELFKKLKETTQFLQADIIMNSRVIKENSNYITLLLTLYHHNHHNNQPSPHIETKEITTPNFNLQQTEEFTVINTLDFLRHYLLNN